MFKNIVNPALNLFQARLSLIVVILMFYCFIFSNELVIKILGIYGIVLCSLPVAIIQGIKHRIYHIKEFDKTLKTFNKKEED